MLKIINNNNNKKKILYHINLSIICISDNRTSIEAMYKIYQMKKKKMLLKKEIF
jgi:hypothetical protein